MILLTNVATPINSIKAFLNYGKAFLHIRLAKTKAFHEAVWARLADIGTHIHPSRRDSAQPLGKAIQSRATVTHAPARLRPSKSTPSNLSHKHFRLCEMTCVDYSP